ncbi:major facilitator superfamily domain-containing protein, partial [Pyronema domesticum]
KRVISFEPGDPENPHNWSMGRKWFITITAIAAVTNSTFASSLPSGVMGTIQKNLNVPHEELTILTISLFLLGYVIGPIGFAPFSEFYGRRWVSIIAFAWFVIFTICCAFAPNIGALLAFRFLAGVGASAPMSVTGGTFADIWPDPVIRGRNMAIFSAVTMVGPTLSPVIGGFIQQTRLGWRGIFYIDIAIAGLSFIPLCLCPETFQPVLLLRKAKRLRAEGETDVIAPIELEDRSIKTALATTLSRPFRMFFKESIVLLVSMYLSIIYGTFYLFFQSYPLIYVNIYHFRAGISGLPFIAVGCGAIFSYISVILWDGHIRKQAAKGVLITTEMRRLPLACVAGPVFVISMFWQGWSARADVHWSASVIAGVPFGFGFSTLFICFLNYVTDFYEIYAASALAACSMSRSLFGASFPLFAKHMYNGLGVAWASSLLGFVALLMCASPFAFMRYGDWVRQKSQFYQFLQERKQL